MNHQSLYPHSSQTVGSALSYLEQRQEWVLDQISELQQRVARLGTTLGVSPDEVGVLPQVCMYISIVSANTNL